MNWDRGKGGDGRAGAAGPNETDGGVNWMKEKKQFALFFIIFLLIFTVVLVPARMLLKRAADQQIFETVGDTNLMDDMPTLVGQDSPFFEAFQDKQRVNVLLLGVNTGLTDTIMVVSFDMKAQHVDIISVPRDTYYYRQGYNSPAEKKINAAYRKDPLNTAMAVSDVLLGLPIHYYAVVDYDGIRNIVDTIGGVPMNIEKAMRYRDPTDKPPLVIDIPAGQQVLDGDHAVQFLRYRKGYTEGDLGRVKAQLEFMKSGFRQAMEYGPLETAKVVSKNIKSDITYGRALEIAAKAVGMDTDSITTYMMPNTPDPNAPYYVYPKAAEIGKMLEEIYSIEPESTSGSAVTGGGVED